MQLFRPVQFPMYKGGKSAAVRERNLYIIHILLLMTFDSQYTILVKLLLFTLVSLRV